MSERNLTLRNPKLALPDKACLEESGSAVARVQKTFSRILEPSSVRGWNAAGDFCGVEMWRGGVGAAYLLPALSSAGASLASPCFRFHIPLIEPDGRISRFRLSEKGSRCRPREMARPPAKAD